MANKEPLADKPIKLGTKTKIILNPTNKDIEVQTDPNQGAKFNEQRERILNKIRTIREAASISSSEAEQLVRLAQKKGRNVAVTNAEGKPVQIAKPKVRVKAISRPMPSPQANPSPAATPTPAPKPAAPSPSPAKTKSTALVPVNKGNLKQALTPVNHTADTQQADRHMQAAMFHHDQYKKLSSQATTGFQPTSLAQKAFPGQAQKFKNRMSSTASAAIKAKRQRNVHLSGFLNKASTGQLQRIGKDHLTSNIDRLSPSDQERVKSATADDFHKAGVAKVKSMMNEDDAKSPFHWHFTNFYDMNYKGGSGQEDGSTRHVYTGSDDAMAKFKPEMLGFKRQSGVGDSQGSYDVYNRSGHNDRLEVHDNRPNMGQFFDKDGQEGGVEVHHIVPNNSFESRWSPVTDMQNEGMERQDLDKHGYQEIQELNGHNGNPVKYYQHASPASEVVKGLHNSLTLLGFEQTEPKGGHTRWEHPEGHVIKLYSKEKGHGLAVWDASDVKEGTDYASRLPRAGNLGDRPIPRWPVSTPIADPRMQSARDSVDFHLDAVNAAADIMKPISPTNEEMMTESHDITFHAVDRNTDGESVQHTLNHAFGHKNIQTYQVHHKGQHIGYATTSKATITTRHFGMSTSGPVHQEKDIDSAVYSPRHAPTEHVEGKGLDDLKEKIKNYHANPPRWMQGKVAKLD